MKFSTEREDEFRGAAESAVLKIKLLLVYLFLTISTLVAFWQVNNCKFTSYDDDIYITENEHIKKGITIDGIRWAFTTGYAANWHPVTWISHMMDIQLFGLNPNGHHATNLLFHSCCFSLFTG